MSTLAEFGTGQVLWSIIWFALFFLWIWVIISLLTDIFRSDDLGGWGKALWVIFLIVAPWIGVLVYLIVRGKGMQQRQLEQMGAIERAQREYIQQVAAPSSAVDEIARLNDLKNSGALSEEEFQSLKSRALSR
jgi:TM2 domain-containing membrane protein YozV